MENVVRVLALTLTGMAAVLLVLILLWGLLKLVRAVFYNPTLKKKENSEFEGVITEEAVRIDVVSDTQEGELIAALTAAIAAYTGKPPESVHIKSFKRAAGAEAWKRAGLIQQLNIQ